MKPEALKEKVIRYIAAQTIVTDENFINDEEVFDIISQCRAAILSAKLDAKQRIAPKNMLTFKVKYDASIQYSTQYKVFPIPNFIQDKIMLVGNEGFKVQYTQNRSEVEITNKQGLWAKTRYLVKGNELQVWNPNVSVDIWINGLVLNPMLIPTFNPDYEEYPLDDSLIDVLMQECFAVYYSKIVQTPIDIISDSQNTPKAV
jgi:hypothetical protein